MKKYKTDSGKFSLELPDDWSCEEDDNRFVFANFDKGWGALQISSYLVTNVKIDLKNELKVVVEEQFSVESENYEIFEDDDHVSCKMTIDDTYWEYHFIHKDSIVLFLTYNCTAIEIEEKQAVEEIIKSILINCP